MRVFRLDDQHPLTGWHMLGIVLTFFAVVIAVNVALAVAATGTFPGLVVANSYISSQHYDELLARAREQEKAGWRDELKSDGGVLRFSLAQGAGENLHGLSVIAHVGRPSTTAEDRIFDLAPASDGSYVANSPLPPGLWEVDLTAGRGADIIFRKTQEVFIKPAETHS